MTKQSYDHHSEEFDAYFQKSFDEVVGKKAAQELLKLKLGKTMLDLGSGPGNHAKFFSDHGFDVTCLDISEPFLKICRLKGLKTIRMDIEKLDLPQEEYDVIWAFASLLHIPRRKIPKVLKNIHAALKAGGLLALAVKEGEGQRYEISKKINGVKRWFVYFSKEELEKLFEPYFEVVYFDRSLAANRWTALHFFLRKKVKSA